MRFRRRRGLLLSLALSLSNSAFALDKQGASHGSAGQAAADEPGVSGSLLLGIALNNTSYAARPDNTGLALMRYAAHADIDIVGRKLSVPIDINMFSDSTRKGALVFAPTEGDVILGLTSAWQARAGTMELGLRGEHDRPLDRSGYSQTYVDFRSRWIWDASDWFSSLKDTLADGTIRGYLTLGTFLYNPTYAARPDNTGLALFRYAFHGEVSLWKNRLAFAIDTTFFTDRTRRHFQPTELDFTPELIGRYDLWELHLAYERDMPLDRSGQIQQFVYMTLGYSFELK
jgi:hypothetical protein